MSVKDDVVKSDVLIVGHGISGCIAAISIKEHNPKLDVLLVDKCCTGYGGKANKGGCNLIDCPDNVKPSEISEWQVKKNAEYLIDQNLNLDYFSSLRYSILKLESWGIQMFRNEDGSFRYRPNCPQPWKSVAFENDIVLRLARYAKKLGCRFVEKETITDLLTSKGCVCGAVGFNIVNGEKHTYYAKALLLACGDQNYRIARMWSSGRGDGAAAAFRAGARWRNAEFGTFFQPMRRDVMCGINYSDNHMYNAKGEYISAKYRPWLNDPAEDKYFGSGAYDVNAAFIAGLYKETVAGNGPIFYNKCEDTYISNVFQSIESTEFYNRPKFRKHRDIVAENWKKGMDRRYKDIIPMTAQLIGEQSPIEVDHNMASTLTGLWAAGDACYGGSAAMGAVPAPPGRLRGSGIAFAAFSALKAAPCLVNYVERAPDVEPDSYQAEKLLADAFAPMKRTDGVCPLEVVNKVRLVMSQIKYAVYHSQERLEEGLELILQAKRLLEEMHTTDYHYLCTANEARSMVLAAEMHFRSAMLRKESRGWFIREDYPERDDENWLKYITIRLEDPNKKDVYTFETLDCPIETYPLKPGN